MLSACANRDGSPKTVADVLIFDPLAERQAQTKEELDIFRFKCNVFLSSYDSRIFSKQKNRYFTAEEKEQVKKTCEKRFGAFPNNNYVLSEEQMNRLKASGALSR